ncbi:MAG: type II toxin-antitoxin system VapC family toxin [Terracidiphilus sp.]|jgi:predicted nucleic acid-binding protein
MSILLDTDIAIEILRARDQAILAKWTGFITTGATVLYSPVTAAEVWAGALPNEYQIIARFFRPLICIPTDYEIGRLAGELLRRFAKSRGLEIGDAFIAATAIQHQTSLWTRNRKHYPMADLVFHA